MFLFHGAIRLSALWNAKARKWVAGRRRWHQQLVRWRSTVPEGAPVLWMHCASLGEFEQGRPVLEAIRSQHPSYQVVLTFYSPSGLEARKQYAGAEYIAYLPADTPRNARRWTETLQPNLVLFVKYEFWYFHLKALRDRHIPHVLIAAHFRRNQLFFRPSPIRPFFQSMLQGWQHLFVQRADSRSLLESAGVAPGKISLAGDPRIDRVWQIREEPLDDPLLDAFSEGQQVFVAGSTWEPDERLLADLLTKLPENWKLLLAPHDVSDAHVRTTFDRFTVVEPTVRYTRTTPRQATDARVMIVDTIGLLNRIYRLGRLAYIGGGFGAGIHNTLEPAAYFLPVLMGPKYSKFPEAVELIRSGGAFSVSDAPALRQHFKYLLQEEAYAAAQRAVQDFMESNRGSTHRITTTLRNRGLL